MAVTSSCIRVTPCLIVIMNSGLVVVCRRVAVMYGRLVHLAICIVGSGLVIVTATIANINRRTSLVEVAVGQPMQLGNWQTLAISV